MTEFPAALFREMMPTFLGMSDDQMAPWVREKIRSVVERGHTDAEFYDVLAEVAAISIFRIGPKAVVGEISGFVQQFCNVTEFYRRPGSEVKDVS